MDFPFFLSEVKFSFVYDEDVLWIERYRTAIPSCRIGPFIIEK
jgi:hypothetical protein